MGCLFSKCCKRNMEPKIKEFDILVERDEYDSRIIILCKKNLNADDYNIL